MELRNDDRSESHTEFIKEIEARTDPIYQMAGKLVEHLTFPAHFEEIERRESRKVDRWVKLHNGFRIELKRKNLPENHLWV